MERSTKFKIISTVITSGIFAYLVYLVISFAVCGGLAVDIMESDLLLKVLPVFPIPTFLSIVWAFIQRRYWWIPSLASVVLFVSIFCVGGACALIGLLGLIIVPCICCMIMIWTKRNSFGGDDDWGGEPRDTTYYGQDKI